MTLINVGSINSPSAYGTYDQNGNVSELVDISDGGIALPSGALMGGNYKNNYDQDFEIQLYTGSGILLNNSTDSIGFRLVSLSNTPVTNFVRIGDLGNAPDTNNFGSINYDYQIGKYEVTVAEYIEFLNAVASIIDSQGLYDSRMPINRVFNSATNRYTYTTKNLVAGNDSYAISQLPITWVSYMDAIRYANWLHNGKPTNVIQNGSSTEDGSYAIAPINSAPVRKSGATFVLPNRNEWYKAAYYKGGSNNSGYYKFATQSDKLPKSVSSSSSADAIDCVPGAVFEISIAVNFIDVCCSSSGQKVAAIAANGICYISNDAGQTWIQNAILGINPTYNPIEIVSSSDGMVLAVSWIAANDESSLVTASQDGGQSWTVVLNTSSYSNIKKRSHKNCLAISSDGTKLALLGSILTNVTINNISYSLLNSVLYVTTNNLSAWVRKNLPTTYDIDTRRSDRVSVMYALTITNNLRYGNNAIVIYGNKPDTNITYTNTVYCSVDNGDTFLAMYSFNLWDENAPNATVMNPYSYNNYHRLYISNNDTHIIYFDNTSTGFYIRRSLYIKISHTTNNITFNYILNPYGLCFSDSDEYVFGFTNNNTFTSWYPTVKPDLIFSTDYGRTYSIRATSDSGTTLVSHPGPGIACSSSGQLAYFCHHNGLFRTFCIPGDKSISDYLNYVRTDGTPNIGTCGKPTYYGMYDHVSHVYTFLQHETAGLAPIANILQRSSVSHSTVSAYGRIASLSNPYNFANFAPVGNANNPSNSATTSYGTNIGSVSYSFYMNTFLITIEDYCEYLNSLKNTPADTLQTLGIYHSQYPFQKIIVSRSNSIITSFKPSLYSSKVPIMFSYHNLVRYCNWLHNNKPTGIAGLPETTESGAYSLGAPLLNPPVQFRSADAKYFVPSLNEWYKAGYYNGNNGYFLYPTQQSDFVPQRTVSVDQFNNALFSADRKITAVLNTNSTHPMTLYSGQ